MDLKLALLKRHPLADGLSEEEILKLDDDFVQMDVATNEQLHSAGDPLDSFFLIVRGRFQHKITDQLQREVLQGHLTPGSQFGGLSAASEGPVPITVTASEPSIALRIDYQVFLQHAAANPQLLLNFIRLIGGMLGQTLGINRLHQQPKVVLIFHGCKSSRPLTMKLIDRLQELGERPCLLTTDPSRKTRADIQQLMLVENGKWIENNEARRQISRWAAKERVFFEVDSDVEQERLMTGMEVAERVLFCVTPGNEEEVLGRLQSSIAREPKWREKVSLVWIVNGEELYPTPPVEISELCAGDFKVSFSDSPTHYGDVWKQGIERIVHQLRGVRIGIALGGGAARGMAHLGVLRTLEQNGIVVDMISGTSAGAMTGMFYASGMDMDYIVDCFVRDLRPSWLFRSMPGGNYWYLLYKYRRRQFDPMLRKYLTELTIEQLPIPMSSITVDLVSGKPKIRDHGDAVQSIIESINLPVLAEPVCRDGEALVDGGLVNNVPADVLVQKGCNFVIAVSVTAQLEQKFGRIRPDTPGPKLKAPSSLQTIMRGYLVQSVNMNSIGVSPADFIIEPDVTTFDLAEFSRTDELARIGVETTESQLEEIRKSLSALDESMFKSN